MDSTSKKLELIAEAVINKLEGDNDMGGGASTNKEKRTEERAELSKRMNFVT